jgi:uncharacterized membrane protein
MNGLEITKKYAAWVLIGWWVCFAALIHFEVHAFYLRTIVGGGFLLIVPGMLFLAALKIHRIELWGRIGLTVGSSIFLLMGAGFVGNSVLPFAGVLRPLDTKPLFFVITLLCALLGAVAWSRFEPIKKWLPRYGVADSGKNFLFAFAPSIFVALSIFGAMRLNNGVGNGLTLVTLFLMGVYVFVLMRQSDRVDRNVIPIALFWLALALLYMTSLRGWHISGHDIQREFFVFQLAKDAGIWNVSTYVDAYNACLSITLLPTLIANLLAFPDEYIYKVLYPIIFAITPGIAYLIARNWVDRRMALTAGVLFFAFPTFFQDMPFLARQEIAFLFYGLMLYILFKQHIALKVRQLLFVVLGTGVVLSHYSTTYTTLFIFALATVAMPIFLRLLKRYKHIAVLQSTALDLYEHLTTVKQKRITVGMVVGLVLVGAAWTLVITNTNDHLERVLHETWDVAQGGAQEEDRSVDVLRLIGIGVPVEKKDLSGYLEHVVQPLRAEHPEYFFTEEEVSAYEVSALTPELVPVTSLGDMLGAGGRKTISLIGQLLGKVLQVATILGLLYVIAYRTRVRYIDSEFYLLAIFSMVFVLMTMVLPVLSNEYGVFRALQQSMYVVAPFMVVGITVVCTTVSIMVERLWSRRGKTAPFEVGTVGENLVAVCAVTFFWYSTSLVGQLIGGLPPAFHLNNEGSDYRQYMVQGEDVAATHWLDMRAKEYMARTGEPMMVIQTDRHAQNKIRSVIQSGVSQDLHPATVQKATYVFASQSIRAGKVAVTYNGRSLLYSFPTAFLEDHKDRVYSNGGVDIYR